VRAARRPDLLAVGDVMLDVIAPSSPEEAVHTSVQLRAGGSVVNAALAAARDGASAGVVGRIGADAAGEMVRSALDEAGIAAWLAVDPELATGTVVYAAGKVVADRGATARLAPADLPADLEAAAVLVSGYVLLHESTEQAGRAALDRARSDWIAVDMAAAQLLARAGPDRALELAGGANVLLANEEEARVLTGVDAPAAARALGRRFRVACVKRGPEGAVACVDGELLEAPAPRRLSPGVGAGDAFAAGLLVALARGAPAQDALVAACRTGTDALI
jgi:sugar/nucleoside kinase (ribokinase family)